LVRFLWASKENERLIKIFSYYFYLLLLLAQKKKQEKGTRLSRPAFSGIPSASRYCRDAEKLTACGCSNSRSLRLPPASYSDNEMNDQLKHLTERFSLKLKSDILNAGGCDNLPHFQDRNFVVNFVSNCSKHISPPVIFCAARTKLPCIAEMQGSFVLGGANLIQTLFNSISPCRSVNLFLDISFLN